ncbi:MAG: hypothetical protein P4M07_09030 [Xanthobacteraceae bacterium]|nr:hypothetical protein [Xanthobacteraceae bacterium]
MSGRLPSAEALLYGILLLRKRSVAAAPSSGDGLLPSFRGGLESACTRAHIDQRNMRDHGVAGSVATTNAGVMGSGLDASRRPGTTQ